MKFNILMMCNIFFFLCCPLSSDLYVSLIFFPQYIFSDKNITFNSIIIFITNNCIVNVPSQNTIFVSLNLYIEKLG